MGTSNIIPNRILGARCSVPLAPLNRQRWFQPAMMATYTLDCLIPTEKKRAPKNNPRGSPISCSFTLRRQNINPISPSQRSSGGRTPRRGAFSPVRSTLLASNFSLYLSQCLFEIALFGLQVPHRSSASPGHSLPAIALGPSRCLRSLLSVTRLLSRRVSK